ncbi:MAG: c-type cytochrome, partial [Acidobacteriota bacterium]|nr:c-type cytochrome [Acidobacteriota bacterium]
MKLLIFLLSTALTCLAQTDTAEAQRNPFAGNAQAIATGKTLYGQACVACHGGDARGERAPSLVSGNLAHGNADGQVFINIRSGIRGTQMPAFAQFTTDQTWQLISYLRSLSTGPVAAPAAMAAGGDPASGKAIFNGKGTCSGCHQIQGVGTAVGPDLSTAGRMTPQQIQAKITNPNLFQGGGGRRGFAARPATVVAKTPDGREYRGTQKGLDSFTVQMVDT